MAFSERFKPGHSGNPAGGRPTKVAAARRLLQPLTRLGVLDSELQALAEACVSNHRPCWDATMHLISVRLMVDFASLDAPPVSLGQSVAR